jgi:hypothetical protein
MIKFFSKTWKIKLGFLCCFSLVIETLPTYTNRVESRVLILILSAEKLKNVILLTARCHVRNLHTIAMPFFASNAQNYVFA